MKAVRPYRHPVIRALEIARVIILGIAKFVGVVIKPSREFWKMIFRREINHGKITAEEMPSKEAKFVMWLHCITLMIVCYCVNSLLVIVHSEATSALTWLLATFVPLIIGAALHKRVSVYWDGGLSPAKRVAKILGLLVIALLAVSIFTVIAVAWYFGTGFNLGLFQLSKEWTVFLGWGILAALFRVFIYVFVL